MNDTFFDKFMLLVQMDKRIYDVSRQKKESEISLEQLSKKIEQVKEILIKSQKELSDLQKKVDYQELELKTLDLKLKESKKKFINTKSAKEYASLTEEIKSLEQEREIRDEVLMVLWQDLESKNKYITNLEQEHISELEELSQSFEGMSKFVIELATSIQIFEEERISILELIPDDFLGDYIYMYKQVPNPAVEVKGQLCGACFCVIPSGDLSVLKRRKLLRCKQCYRILFLDSE